MTNAQHFWLTLAAVVVTVALLGGPRLMENPAQGPSSIALATTSEFDRLETALEAHGATKTYLKEDGSRRQGWYSLAKLGGVTISFTDNIQDGAEYRMGCLADGSPEWYCVSFADDYMEKHAHGQTTEIHPPHDRVLAIRASIAKLLHDAQ